MEFTVQLDTTEEPGGESLLGPLAQHAWAQPELISPAVVLRADNRFGATLQVIAETPDEATALGAEAFRRALDAAGCSETVERVSAEPFVDDEILVPA